MATAHVVHFGCRLNQYESDALAGGLGERGLTLVDDIRAADYVILNTCTVTNRADQKNRSAIRHLHDENPAAKIIVTGCYATTDAEEIKNMPGVYWVVSNLNKAAIPSLVAAEQGQAASEPADGQFGYSLRSRQGHARAALKIQDGCNRTCSYCKIPQARGPARSRSFQNTLDEARRLIDLGFSELTVTGVNIGWYKGEGGENFEDLLEALLNLPGRFLLRISSIEPPEVSERLADLLTHTKMARFLHAPLQSGSQSILALMRRGYNLAQYRRRIEQVRNRDMEIHIGTDVIVGFPGESDALFEETLQFCREMQFANIHAFPFSLRKGTPVQAMLHKKAPLPGSDLPIHEIPGDVIRERMKRLTELGDVLAANYRQQTAGRVWRAVIEKNTEGILTATSENYIKLKGYHLGDFARGELVNITYDTSGQITFIERA